MATEKQSVEVPEALSARYTTCRSLQKIGESVAQILPHQTVKEMDEKMGDEKTVLVCDGGVFIPFQNDSKPPEAICVRYEKKRKLMGIGNSTTIVVPSEIFQETARGGGDQQKVVVCGKGVFLPYE